MSQEKLAETCGYDRSYLSGIEGGKRNIAAFYALADALGANPIQPAQSRP